MVAGLAEQITMDAEVKQVKVSALIAGLAAAL